MARHRKPIRGPLVPLRIRMPNAPDPVPGSDDAAKAPNNGLRQSTNEPSIATASQDEPSIATVPHEPFPVNRLSHQVGAEPAAFVDLFQTLRRRRRILFVCVIVAVGAAAAFAAITPKRYAAVAELYFHDPMVTAGLFSSAVNAPVEDPVRTAATDLALVQLETVAARTAGHFASLGASRVSSEVKTKADGQSDLVVITATDRNPKLAAQLANTYASEFVTFRRDFDRGTIQNALSLIAHEQSAMTPQQRAAPNGRSLSDKARQLRIFESLQTGNVVQVQRASVPTSPSSPRPLSDVSFGLIAGLLIGLGLSLLVDRLDQKLRDPDEVQHLFGRPLLGQIPAFNNRTLSHAPIVSEPRADEAFLMLRTNLRYFQLGRPVSVVLTTSAEPGDGKTTVSWNLAAAAATAGEKVLLIEADLRRPEPSVNQIRGLVQVLFGELKFEDALVTRSAGVGTPTFEVLVAGAVPPNPAELLESQAMSELVRLARERYDLIVIDCPPVTLVADAIPLLRFVDGALIVASVARTSRDTCRRLRSELEELEAPVLGVVVNRIKAEARYRDYYHVGGSSRPDAPGKPAGDPA